MDARAQGRGQPLYALAILIALGAVLALAAGGSRTSGREAAAAEPATEPASLDPAALARISVQVEPRVARRVEEIRGLEFDRIPKPEIVDSEYLNRLSAREARRRGAYEGIGADEAELRILGLLAPDEQLESILGSTGDLAAAAYDTDSDRLYVVEDAVVANRALVEFVLAHELTHALEDQRFGLPRASARDDDQALARIALSEGTATAVMIEYAAQDLSPADLLAASASLESGTGDVPQVYVDQLLWTYLGGARFTGSLRTLAGGWKLVDYALRSRPPDTTEQVLHPKKYVRDERPLQVPIENRELRDRGWRRADRGVIGELSTSQLLELGADQATARRAARDWGGDRLELWRRDVAPAGCADPCRGDLVLIADWRSDSIGAAGRLRETVGDYLELGLDAERGASGLWTLDGGAAAVRAAGDEVALVFAPDASTALAIAEEQIAP